MRITCLGGVTPLLNAWLFFEVARSDFSNTKYGATRCARDLEGPDIFMISIFRCLSSGTGTYEFSYHTLLHAASLPVLESRSQQLAMMSRSSSPTRQAVSIVSAPCDMVGVSWAEYYRFESQCSMPSILDYHAAPAKI
jgi:hypothetical protein